MLKNTQLPIQNTLYSKGAILDLSKPIVMGIININDASFYANSRITNTEQVLEKATQMLAEGAAIIDFINFYNFLTINLFLLYPKPSK